MLPFGDPLQSLLMADLEMVRNTAHTDSLPNFNSDWNAFYDRGFHRSPPTPVQEHSDPLTPDQCREYEQELQSMWEPISPITTHSPLANMSLPVAPFLGATSPVVAGLPVVDRVVHSPVPLSPPSVITEASRTDTTVQLNSSAPGRSDSIASSSSSQETSGSSGFTVDVWNSRPLEEDETALVKRYCKCSSSTKKKPRHWRCCPSNPDRDSMFLICSECGTRFKGERADNLRRHMKKKHRGVSSRVNGA